MSLESVYTKKQIDVLRYAKNNDFFIAILHGAKRAGKTVANNDLFLKELIRVKKVAAKIGIDKPQYILAGNSLGNLQRNVMIELTNKYGIEFHMDKYNRFELFGVQVCCFGHGTIRDLGRIRGMTSFGAYINEGSTAVNEVFKEILNRCSGEGARVMVDTNPDNPLHWLKKDYIDKADGKTIVDFHFSLYDNSFLTDRYIKNIEAATPTGVFTDRDIKGLWVSAEGVVYKDFDLNKHVIEKVPNDVYFEYYIGGIDWGFDHYGSIVVIGVANDGKYYLLEEESCREKYVEDYWIPKAKELQDKYPEITFYADTARPEYISQMNQAGVYVINANKSVQEGIGYVGSLLKQNKLFFIKDKFVKGAEEMFLYVWATAKSNGKEEVVKTNDDVLDSLRYALFTDSVNQFDMF